MKIYLCGPMTPFAEDDYNRSAFDRIASRLRHLGHEVFNPGESDANVEGHSFAECMKIDLQEVLNADALVVLPRWEIGVGTRVEVAVALSIGLPIYEYKGGILFLSPLFDPQPADDREFVRMFLDGELT